MSDYNPKKFTKVFELPGTSILVRAETAVSCNSWDSYAGKTIPKGWATHGSLRFLAPSSTDEGAYTPPMEISIYSPKGLAAIIDLRDRLDEIINEAQTLCQDLNDGLRAPA